jgi:hypothetical protein
MIAPLSPGSVAETLLGELAEGNPIGHISACTPLRFCVPVFRSHRGWVAWQGVEHLRNGLTGAAET